SASSDYQTPSSALQVSWDFVGAATSNPPWSPWTATKAATFTYLAAGTYAARVAVADADGDVGYGDATVVVLPPGATLCRVDTSAAVDDGAMGCAGPFGVDGALSFAEAIRISNGAPGKQ